jgi:hypothetical protein
VRKKSAPPVSITLTTPFSQLSGRQFKTSWELCKFALCHSANILRNYRKRLVRGCMVLYTERSTAQTTKLLQSKKLIYR